MTQILMPTCPEPTVTGRSEGAARLLALPSVMCWDIKRADDAVNQYIKSSDALKQCIARPAKNRYGVCEGEGAYFSRTNLYDIKRWFAFYSSQIEFVHQTGGQLQKVDNANTPIPEILLGVSWTYDTPSFKSAFLTTEQFYLPRLNLG